MFRAESMRGPWRREQFDSKMPKLLHFSIGTQANPLNSVVPDFIKAHWSVLFRLRTQSASQTRHRVSERTTKPFSFCQLCCLTLRWNKFAFFVVFFVFSIFFAQYVNFSLWLGQRCCDELERCADCRVGADRLFCSLHRCFD
jgi:hypothetical protein